MKTRLFSSFVVAFVAVLLSFGSVSAQEKGKPEAQAPDFEAMMKAYEKAAEPGPAHKRLEKMAGNWDVLSRTWMDPKQPPAESKGSCEARLIHGGRYLVQEFHCDMLGKPFHGLGITGYENAKKQYVSSWTDSFSTGILSTVGTVEADGKTVTYIGYYEDPVLGDKNKKFKAIERIVDADTFVFEMYDSMPGTDEFKMMELTYKRRK